MCHDLWEVKAQVVSLGKYMAFIILKSRNLSATGYQLHYTTYLCGCSYVTWCLTFSLSKIKSHFLGKCGKPIIRRFSVFDPWQQSHMYYSHVIIFLCSYLNIHVFHNHIELLFNKIWHRCRWNNDPSAMQFKYELQRTLIHNSIEPSNTWNWTHSDGMFDCTTKRN